MLESASVRHSRPAMHSTPLDQEVLSSVTPSALLVSFKLRSTRVNLSFLGPPLSPCPAFLTKDLPSSCSIAKQSARNKPGTPAVVALLHLYPPRQMYVPLWMSQEGNRAP